MLASGSAGADGQRAAIEALGGTVVGQWALAGRFNVLLVAEFETDAAAMAASLRATEDGFETELIRAFPPGEIDDAREHARRLDPPEEPA
jgi:uncharacterized protein with GYD domain